MNRTRSLVPTALWVLALVALSGCTADQSNIPANATLAASGNDRLVYTAPSDGMAWVYDVTHDRILWSGQVYMNQSVSVMPDSNTISVGGRVVMDTMPTGAHRRIYFQSSSQTPPANPT